MRLRDRDAWLHAVEANRPPGGYKLDPATWPEEPGKDAMPLLYGASVVVFAERWADLMEAAMAAGATLADCAEQARREADASLGRWGITGFQYGCAAGILARAWEHGESLRCWFNLAVQIHDEGERACQDGGILNSALMTVAGPGAAQ